MHGVCADRESIPEVHGVCADREGHQRCMVCVQIGRAYQRCMVWVLRMSTTGSSPAGNGLSLCHYWNVIVSYSGVEK